MRTMVGDILQQAGFEIVGEAETGVQAVEKYKQLRPDLVTMDIVMPDMGGIDAVREICLDTTDFTCTRGQTPNQVMLGEPTGHTFPELDPPQHRPRRRVLAGDYTPDAARRDAPWIRELAQEALTPLLADGQEGFDNGR